MLLVFASLRYTVGKASFRLRSLAFCFQMTRERLLPFEIVQLALAFVMCASPSSFRFCGMQRAGSSPADRQKPGAHQWIAFPIFV